MSVDRLRKCLESADFEQLGDVFAADAFLDLNVPSWRFQRRGLDAIRAQFAEWYEEPVEITEWRERAIADGILVELETRPVESGVPVTYRTVLLLSIAGDRITELTMYCSGGRDPETLVRNESAEPLLRA